jgi:hypothetical protein
LAASGDAEKAGFAGVPAAFCHHINGVFAADMVGSGGAASDLFEKRADPLFAGYFCLNDRSIARI